MILNGDIVDFKWTTIGSTDDTIDNAIAWLTTLLADFPNCHFHHILGNHDAFTPYADALQILAEGHEHFHWHPTHLQVGTALFHHGDLLLSDSPQRHWNRPMHDRIGVKGKTRNIIYDATISARLHRLPEVLNQPARIARKMVQAVRYSPHPEHAGVTDIYIGHTHTPFNAYEIDGIRVHNTGSAMKHLRFNMLRVEVEEAPKP
jgi:UDP-2,3-diacylglucosamine hydrolase